MATSRELPDDFLYFLKRKDPALVDTFIDLRSYVISIYPESNELLYHTHALTAVYSVSDKLAEGFCHIPIYTEHLNLGFNKGTLVDDPQHLLQGTGKLIRHIPINSRQDYRNEDVRNLIINAVEFEMEDLDDESRIIGQTISKIKAPQ